MPRIVESFRAVHLTRPNLVVLSTFPSLGEDSEHDSYRPLDRHHAQYWQLNRTLRYPVQHLKKSIKNLLPRFFDGYRGVKQIRLR